MLKDYFGAWTSGRLGRARFALLYALLVFLTFGMMLLLLGSAFGVGQLASNPEAVVEAVGRPVVILWLIWLLLVAVAVLNIVGKRGRDIGVPGWAAILAFLLVAGIGRAGGGPGNGLILLFAIVMALIPTGAANRSDPA